MNNVREKMRESLLNSYKHRAGKGLPCASCGATTRLLAFHVLEASFGEHSNLPKTFVPMSTTNGRINGSYPICDQCAPICGKCQLPIKTEKVLELGHQLHAISGIGACEHIQIELLFSSVFKRLFGIGRFSKK